MLAGRCVYGRAVGAVVAVRRGILLTLAVPAGRVQVRGVGGWGVGSGCGRLRGWRGCVGGKRWQTSRRCRFGAT